MKEKKFSEIMELLDKILFYIFDFDNTIAHTFLHIPNADHNIVEDAYTHALAMMWRIDYALELLDRVGGLQNRAPGELIRAILDAEGSGRQGLIDMAEKAFHEIYFRGKSPRELLSDCVPEGKGFPWKWDDRHPEQSIIEFLVRAKLNHLLMKIGPHYPTPCPGFRLFYQAMQNHEEIIPGIISSGHEVFIQKTFDVWELECPQLLLTDDDMRGAKEIDPVQAAKPNPVLLDILYRLWLQHQEITLTNDQFAKFRALAVTKTVYFGDDPKKDGLFAQNAGVRFGHFNAEFDPETENKTSSGKDFVFYDWRQARKILSL